MAVVGVLVEAVVGHEHERVADLVAQVAQRDLHHAVGVVGSRAAGVLGGGDAEEDHRGHAEVGEGAHLLAEALLGVLHDAGHRRDRLGRVDALLHEQRRDQVVDAEAAPRRPGAAGRACAAAGACVARGTSRRRWLPPVTAFGVVEPRLSRSATPKRARRVATRPSMVCSAASASTRRPRCTAVADVTGPIDTTSGLRVGERPTAAQKLSTVDDDVNVTASTSPDAHARERRRVGRPRARCGRRGARRPRSRGRRAPRAARRGPARPGRAARATPARPGIGEGVEQRLGDEALGQEIGPDAAPRELARGAGPDRGDPRPPPARARRGPAGARPRSKNACTPFTEVNTSHS